MSPSKQLFRKQTLPDLFRSALSALIGDQSRSGLVVGLSGGADSTALLHLCAGLQEKMGLSLAAAHLDHGLRGAEGERDRRAAQAAAEGLGVPFHWDKADCRTLALEKKLSLEEAARQSRYAFLERIRLESESAWIAVGHTADDNAELVLMNLLRGAGPEGLSGIPPRRQAIIRPLLSFRRR
ncbi:MAG: tRNA lysidine(34) synthetase TilS, partial [Deltaproteobacteria bacterium]|nr:tRNA lysidine(34) synthetase TilS [Deltaproteobacteria bacterium]